jgi:holliday junction DNA helicase RuvA
MLSGILFLRDDPFIIVEVNGVGYRVYVNQQVLTRLPTIGQALRLFIYTHVREDALELYGFSEAEDLKLFEYLISVSGIGCKTAMGVYAVGNRSEIVSAIIAGDTAFFTAVPRLGKKNAQKVIIELKGKLGSTTDLDLSGVGENDEVIAALESFGFSNREAYAALKAIGEEGESVQDKIKLALKQLGK